MWDRSIHKSMLCVEEMYRYVKETHICVHERGLKLWDLSDQEPGMHVKETCRHLKETNTSVYTRHCHTPIHAHTRTHTHTHIHIHTEHTPKTHIHKKERMCACTCTHTRTHAHTHARYLTCLCVTSWLTDICDMTHSIRDDALHTWHDSFHMWHDSLHTCAMTRFYRVSKWPIQCTQICSTWISDICDMTHSICDMTHSTRVTWLTPTQSVWHDSVIPVTWLIPYVPWLIPYMCHDSCIQGIEVANTTDANLFVIVSPYVNCTTTLSMHASLSLSAEGGTCTFARVFLCVHAEVRAYIYTHMHMIYKYIRKLFWVLL